MRLRLPNEDTVNELRARVFNIAEDIIAERLYQNNKFCKSGTGVQRHHMLTWAAITGEESGEVTKAALDFTFGAGKGRLEHLYYDRMIPDLLVPLAEPERAALVNLRAEAVQTAACAVALIERIDKLDPSLFAPEGTFENTP